jgi:hypothetical protein
MAEYLKNLGLRKPNYDLTPRVRVEGHAGAAVQGWSGVIERMAGEWGRRKPGGGSTGVIAVECYSGVLEEEIREAVRSFLPSAMVLSTEPAFRSPEEIDRLVAGDLGGEDPVFGYMTRLRMEDFLSAPARELLAQTVKKAAKEKIVVLVGAGAALCCEPDLLVYADMPRWEGQLRQRRKEVANLGVKNHGLKASLQYKRSFFIDWRVCDRLKRATMVRWDFLLDTTVPGEPKLVTGAALRDGLEQTARRPFRVVPFFDPGPWGGQWMREVCQLPDGPPNYAWCFDCVPEENSLMLEVDGIVLEIPSINLVFFQSRELLGEAVYARFGAEFPIRFDFLDTMQGGNLSFQVHPTTEFVREHFGLHYTQDESYYILDAEPGAEVYLGCKKGVQAEEMLTALEKAQSGGEGFDDARFVARFPARKHDHFLIPAGTLHCSGAGSMVLEISATPYIFTFKLWDWNRLGLDGLPRPVNIARGREVIWWDRDEDFAREQLVNQAKEVARGEGWVEERTGLHGTEFIETRRHWFTAPVLHRRTGGVEVLNLVEGEEAVVSSPTGAWEPFVVHYAETFILPAVAGDYVITPSVAGKRCGTLKAYVRT